MKKSRFSPTQIVGILKEYENGTKAEELARLHGISTATLYSWRKKYSGMDVGFPFFRQVVNIKIG